MHSPAVHRAVPPRSASQATAIDAATGATIWQAQSNESPCSAGYDGALAPDGSLFYVTGTIADAVSDCGGEFNTDDIGTVAYQAR